MYAHYSCQCNQRSGKSLRSYKNASYKVTEKANGWRRQSRPKTSRSRPTTTASCQEAVRSSMRTTQRTSEPLQVDSSTAAVAALPPCLPVQSIADRDPLLLQAEKTAALGPIVDAVDSNLSIESADAKPDEVAASTQALEGILQNFEPHSSSLQVKQVAPLVHMPHKPSPFADMAVQEVYILYFSGPEAILEEVAGLKRTAEAVAQCEDPFSVLQPTPLVSVQQLASRSKFAPCIRTIVEVLQDSNRGSVDRNSSRQPLTIVLRFATDHITAPKAVPNAWQDSVDCTVFIKIIPKRHSNNCAKVQERTSNGVSTSPASCVKSAPVAHAGKSHVQRMQELLLARFAGAC